MVSVPRPLPRTGGTPACEKQSANVSWGRCVACTASNATQCTGAKPVCDPFTNVCVRCQVDADCGGGATPVCALPSHTCVACKSNNDCYPGGGVCATFITMETVVK